MLGTNPNQAGLNLEHLRIIVITGPDTLGRRQVVTELKESEQQLLDIEEVAVTNQQKGVGGIGLAKYCSLHISRQLKRDRATDLAVFPNTTFPPNLPHVKGEGESERMQQIDHALKVVFFSINILKVVWLLCEPSRIPGGLDLPQALAEKMLTATRFLEI